MDNRIITIAVGASRFDVHWKNTKMTWDELVTRLSKSVETKETHEEYMKSSKDVQDRIKDIGGFVGGELIADGKRGNGTIQCRTLLTLDLDNASKDFWDDFTMWNEFECVVYGTHKHTPNKPRLRLVAPLSRECTPEEYQALARKIASDIGIEQMDRTTYQAARLMYWASHSKGTEPFFEHQEGPWIDVDATLARYKDWHDVSQWAFGPDEQKAVCQAVKKVASVEQKVGIVGAFCRVYSISRAIETFIPDAYKPAGSDRWTYVQGSTSGGAVVYENDTILYSNHGTDPAGGRALNAFDLVRIHKFRNLDKDKPEDTKVTKLPSYNAMCELARQDAEVMKQLTMESVSRDNGGSFSEAKQALTSAGADKLPQITRSKTGAPEQTIENFVTILKEDPNLRNLGGLNLLTMSTEVAGPLPWNPNKREGDLWTDADDAGLRFYIESTYNLSGKDRLYDATEYVFNTNAYHPVRDYLSSLSWDGVPRAERILIDYLGADDTDYVRCVTRKVLCGACARVFQPGIKFDYMLTLTGRQGVGKSTLIRRLGMDWYSDTLTSVNGKDALDQLHGVWLMEMSELTATRKADVEAVKQFISKQSDRYRMAYARRTGEYPRQCIFIGSTNEGAFLHDRTGNRRFWVVELAHDAERSVWDDFTQDIVDQVWAEAMTWYNAGEKLYLPEEIAKQAELIQESHKEDDAEVYLITEYLNRKLPEDWNDKTLAQRRIYLHGDDFTQPDMTGTVERSRVCPLEIAAELFGVDKVNITTPTARSTLRLIRQTLDNMPNEWRRFDSVKKFSIHGPQRGYYRVGGADDENAVKENMVKVQERIDETQQANEPNEPQPHIAQQHIVTPTASPTPTVAHTASKVTVRQVEDEEDW